MPKYKNLSPSDLLKLASDEDITWIDLRFTDTRGTWQHLTMDASVLDEDTLEEGLMFDGSSIAGWKAINESDMVLKPDLSHVTIDPFAAEGTLVVFCDILEPATGQPYVRDPRSTAKRAEEYLKYTGIGDTVYFGPEPEFFVFDDVRFKIDYAGAMYALDDIEGPYNSGKTYADGNQGHRPRVKGGYFPVGPVDAGFDLRGEMVSVLRSLGVKMDKHHHEVAASQHELGITFGTLTEMADKVQLYKYVVRQVAHSYGKTATFMPKPVKDDNGSGMHVHQSLWKGGKPLFAGSGYADLSETALYYIGGIIKHARAINAFTNPGTNSYKRLTPGFEAPVLLAYSARNRSASCRIPYATSPKGKRVEVRFPDPTANPYLGFAAMLMAGLDGIENKIHPGDAMDKDLYALPPEELTHVPTVARSLREALESLQADCDFLKKGEVFSQDQIDAYIHLKFEEVTKFELAPHPIEFDMYYSA
ncbi:MAG: type I glutamate--ammonia ligase [Rhodothalassiaceae bacterium]